MLARFLAKAGGSSTIGVKSFTGRFKVSQRVKDIENEKLNVANVIKLGIALRGRDRVC
jgi:hypothetical protein